jgi:hypothetical protein
MRGRFPSLPQLHPAYATPHSLMQFVPVDCSAADSLYMPPVAVLEGAAPTLLPY